MTESDQLDEANDKIAELESAITDLEDDLDRAQERINELEAECDEFRVALDRIRSAATDALK